MFTWNLPGKQVSVGDDWNITAADQFRRNDARYNHNLSSGRNRWQQCKYNRRIINIKTAANAVPIQSGGATVTYDDIQGLTRSNIVIDIRTGLIVETIGKTHITGNLGISAPGFSMQMPMDINGESKVVAL
ncbi:MAG: hypothetical protein MZV63_67910 [Marinilabiliales bacterium]|nr:hypothetical protein [Marinilabiliales bacterium]